MIIWKNKLEKWLFEFLLVFSVFWTLATLPYFIMYYIFGWSN